VGSKVDRETLVFGDWKLFKKEAEREASIELLLESDFLKEPVEALVETRVLLVIMNFCWEVWNSSRLHFTWAFIWLDCVCFGFSKKYCFRLREVEYSFFWPV